MKVKRDAPALGVLGSWFHQCETMNENSLDCCTCTDGSAKRHEDYRSAAFQTLEAGTFTYSFFSFYIYLLFIKYLASERETTMGLQPDLNHIIYIYIKSRNFVITVII